jgi:hypothetical protein
MQDEEGKLKVFSRVRANRNDWGDLVRSIYELKPSIGKFALATKLRGMFHYVVAPPRSQEYILRVCTDEFPKSKDVDS